MAIIKKMYQMTQWEINQAKLAPQTRSHVIKLVDRQLSRTTLNSSRKTKASKSHQKTSETSLPIPGSSGTKPAWKRAPGLLLSTAWSISKSKFPKWLIWSFRRGTAFMLAVIQGTSPWCSTVPILWRTLLVLLIQRECQIIVLLRWIRIFLEMIEFIRWTLVPWEKWMDRGRSHPTLARSALKTWTSLSLTSIRVNSWRKDRPIQLQNESKRLMYSGIQADFVASGAWSSAKTSMTMQVSLTFLQTPLHLNWRVRGLMLLSGCREGLLNRGLILSFLWVLEDNCKNRSYMEAILTAHIILELTCHILGSWMVPRVIKVIQLAETQWWP